MRTFIEKTFSNTVHRPDAHSLRYEFRHLVNAGLVSVASYDAFVALVDEKGSLRDAVRSIVEDKAGR